MTTIKDVARLAGVSPITASRAVNNPAMVSSVTLMKVRSAVEQLGYEPNLVAKGLRSGQTRIITLVVNQKSNYDPLLFEFATGISESCRVNGYSLLIYPCTDRQKQLDSTLFGKADGVVLTEIEDGDWRIETLLGKIPITIFGESQYDIPQIDIDDVSGAKMATEYLLSLGYRQIVMVTSDANMLFLKHRNQGYMEAILAVGCEPTVAFGSLDIQGGEAAMNSLVTAFDAVLCASDSMAIGVLRYLHASNLKVPVVGYDGGFHGEITTPRLTSVKQPFYAAGEFLADAMFELLRSGTVAKRLIQPTLVIRESTWPKQ